MKRQEIPKTGGGTRQLGIPTVLDRLIQQCLLQVLQPIFDPAFSEHSHGYRPGRSAHDAVCAAQQYIQSGRRWVADVDLEKFFDRVNHDVLMERLSRKIADTRMLRVIRRYLEAGLMANGVVVERYEGTPQGGPLSPLLSNVLLDEVDKELEKRGLVRTLRGRPERVYWSKWRGRCDGDAQAAVRAAPVAGQRGQEHGGASVGAQVPRLQLWVPYGDPTSRRTGSPRGDEGSRARITSCTGGRSMMKVAEELRSYLTGWKRYFRLAETPSVFRRRPMAPPTMRAVQLKQWKHGPPCGELLVRASGAARASRGPFAGGRRRHMAHHTALPTCTSTGSAFLASPVAES